MQEENESLVTFSTAAVNRIRSIFSEVESPRMLRVYVEGGGCAGMQYGFRIEQERAEDDFVVQADDVTILIDSVSSQYLAGSNVDFRSDLEGERFVIRNPNAATTCGCSSSFST